jgi:hypothetical protein
MGIGVSFFRASYETALFLGFGNAIKILEKGKDKGQAHQGVFFDFVIV